MAKQSTLKNSLVVTHRSFSTYLLAYHHLYLGKGGRPIISDLISNDMSFGLDLLPNHCGHSIGLRRNIGL